MPYDAWTDVFWSLEGSQATDSLGATLSWSCGNVYGPNPVTLYWTPGQSWSWYRTPSLSVRLGVTRQSSCAKSEMSL